jgi:uncharacterized protein YecE (DUF72 family)
MESFHRFFVGTSGWTYDHWKGNFYPADLPKTRWFDHYAATFSTVEINATFYRTFKDTTYHKWYDKAPPGFTYVLKTPRPITHYRHLEGSDAEIQAFWRSANLLGDKFGLILLQIAPDTPYDLGRLQNALLAFSDPSRVAVEFRHDQWYTGEVRDLLARLGAVFCDADSPRNHLRGWVTSQAAYIRLHGRQRWYAYNYSEDELRDIAQRAKNMAREGASRVYIFFNNDFEGYAPANARLLQKMLEGS